MAGADQCLELGAVVHGHAEQLADDSDRQGEGELGHDVDDGASAAVSAMVSRSSSHSATTCGRSASTVLGVKARATRPRRRVWSGGLSVSID